LNNEWRVLSSAQWVAGHEYLSADCPVVNIDHSLLNMHYSLVSTHASLCITQYSPVTTQKRMPISQYSPIHAPIIIHHIIFIAYYTPIIGRYLLMITFCHYQWLIVHHWLGSAHCFPLPACCSLITNQCSCSEMVYLC
jgi:hypothetical protein